MQECAVVGLPDAEAGEVVGAFVALNKEGQEVGAAQAQKDLEKYLAAKISEYKMPSSWKFVDALPRN